MRIYIKLSGATEETLLDEDFLFPYAESATVSPPAELNGRWTIRFTDLIINRVEYGLVHVYVEPSKYQPGAWQKSIHNYGRDLTDNARQKLYDAVESLMPALVNLPDADSYIVHQIIGQIPAVVGFNAKLLSSVYSLVEVVEYVKLYTIPALEKLAQHGLSFKDVVECIFGKTGYERYADLPTSYNTTSLRDFTQKNCIEIRDSRGVSHVFHPWVFMQQLAEIEPLMHESERREYLKYKRIWESK